MADIFWLLQLQIFIWGSSNIGLYLEVISMHFRVFSAGQGSEWRIFFGCYNFKYLFGVLEMKFMIFFFCGGGGGG